MHSRTFEPVQSHEPGVGTKARFRGSWALLIALSCGACADGTTDPDSVLNHDDSGADDDDSSSDDDGADDDGSSSDDDVAADDDAADDDAADDDAAEPVECDEAAQDLGGNDAPAVPWDWAGVIGTGQSLAVGQNGSPAKSTTQPYENMKLSTGTAMWPIDPADESFELVPLTEPIGRPSTAYPSSYPTNIAGETPHASMANQVTAMVQEAGADYIGVHGEFGENGQPLTYLAKEPMEDPNGVLGRAYQASLLETEAVTRLAEAAGMTYGVGALIVTHGESDAGNGSYADGLYQLLSDYNADVKAITGQSEDILMIVSQQNSITNRSASTLAAWKLGVEHPEEVVCSGPKYQYRYAQDNVHLITDGYRMLGEKYGQVYFERVVMGRNWQPLQPESATRSGRTITVDFHVPVPPLEWDMNFDTPLEDIAEWAAGNGFEVFGGGKRITIESVDIVCNSVRIACAEELPDAVTVGYAMTASATAMGVPFNATTRWGRLKDSDPFVGSVTGEPQPNYAVAFEMPVE